MISVVATIFMCRYAHAVFDKDDTTATIPLFACFIPFINILIFLAIAGFAIYEKSQSLATFRNWFYAGKEPPDMSDPY